MVEVDYEGVLSGVKVIWNTDIPDFKYEIDMINSKDNFGLPAHRYQSFLKIPKFILKSLRQAQTNDVTESYKFMYTVKKYKLWDSKGTDNTTSDYINKVTINDFENSSEKNGYTFTIILTR